MAMRPDDYLAGRLSVPDRPDPPAALAIQMGSRQDERMKTFFFYFAMRAGTNMENE